MAIHGVARSRPRSRPMRARVIGVALITGPVAVLAWGGGSALAARRAPSAARGPAWTVQAMPHPKGALQTYLDGLACTSATACTAVGSSIPKYGNYLTLAERRSGRAWTVQRTPDRPGPAPYTVDTVAGVSCRSGSCILVGSYEPPGTTADQGLAERWNGAGWELQAFPVPKGTVENLLSGISCTSPGACTAVGESTMVDGEGRTLAARWNGAKWQIEKSANPAGSRVSQLRSVSCVSPTSCTAVGDYLKRSAYVTLAEQWNGRSWKVIKTPNPSGSDQVTLAGVSCTTARACMAVGYYDLRTGDRMLAEIWNGKSWKTSKPPAPAHTNTTSLNAVSCLRTGCIAVGGSAITTVTHSLAEHWNGRTWAIEPSRNPAGSTYSALVAVSCISVTVCTADGYYDLGTDTDLPFAEIEGR
jgi:hypothetical protein